MHTVVLHLTDLRPVVAPDELVASLVPPPTFSDVSFASYRPNPDEPSQAAAVAAAEAFVTQAMYVRGSKAGLLRKPRRGIGLYLDGGFGVGKTHLLASSYHAAKTPKLFASFVEITNLVGALGMADTVERLAKHSLVCIDEFELDDPGDTMLLSRLLSELFDRSVSVAATSNTLPGQLGEGRFAANDFLREIRRIADGFQVVRVDGPDYRHRDLPAPPAPLSPQELQLRISRTHGASLDEFDDLAKHLATLHPSCYRELVNGVSAVGVSGMRPAQDQAVALRFVAFIDRLYDAGTPVLVAGEPADKIFTEEMLAGGYRKKYLRAISRITALARAGESVGLSPTSVL
ncbi:AFG1-family ATPase [Segniliparus rotundus DSM 44985]|uniref:AFG1-family ATPase n=1 Tax=Segniliparus rotundus (strain ATCC BAA-972 / CDC 1076 / CIP 108378 / DSM 44985 / JCM 13578) TaxID=640132 RepID=D6Z832_SEGRD|nr:AFG1-family ATPase [Segniliparus rotundus DSM 44985]